MTADYTFVNFAISSIAGGAGGVGSSLNNTDTPLILQTGDGAKFGSPSSTAPLFILLGSVTGTHELCKVTAVSTDTLTIVRAQESTTASTWGIGTTVQAVVSAGVMGHALFDDGGAIATSGSGAISKLNNAATAGSYGVPAIGASAQRQNVTSTTNTTIASVTVPATVTTFRAWIFFHVGAGNTNAGTITAQVNYTDPDTGAQTINPRTYADVAILSSSFSQGAISLCLPVFATTTASSTISVKYQNSAAGTISDMVTAVIELLA